MSVRRYLEGIHEKFGHLATWLPDERLRLGDVGRIEGGRFFQKTTLARLRIKFTPRVGPASGDWDHSSGSDVSVKFGGQAELASVGAPGGRAVVTFGGGGAFLFQALECATQTIEDMADVGNEIIIAHRSKEFEKDWVVIDRVVTARSATILICGSTSARLDLAANAGLGMLTSLADASIGVRAAGWEGEITRFVGQAHLTPMFGASGLRTGVFRATRVEPVRGEGHQQADDAPLTDVPITEWLDSHESAQ